MCRPQERLQGSPYPSPLCRWQGQGESPAGGWGGLQTGVYTRAWLPQPFPRNRWVGAPGGPSSVKGHAVSHQTKQRPLVSSVMGVLYPIHGTWSMVQSTHMSSWAQVRSKDAATRSG